MPSAAFWAMVVVAPLAFYRQRDESVIAVVSMLVVTIVLMLR